jgi:hypothetical protein
MKHAMAVALTLVLASFVAAQSSKHSNVPQFEDFPETEKWAGSPVKVVLDRTPVRMFRTQFRLASLQPPNFAGHYRIAIWGCGTQCLEGGMVDLVTGRVVELPSLSSLRGKGPEYWRLCDSAFQPSGIESRANSRLLIIRCANIIGKDGGTYLRTSYFVLENESFKKIGEVKGEERVF